MSEFKFACPVCGQHITADSSASGTRLECPTCFQRIIAPQAPSSGDPKLILSASKVSAARSNPCETGAELAAGRLRKPGSKASLAPLLLLVCTGSTALFLWRNQLNSLANGLAERATSPAPKAPLAAGLKPVQPIPTNFTWSLNVTNAPLPNTEVAGSIHGNGFLCERATLRAGRFSLRQGQTGPPDLGITVLLGVRQPEELSGKTVVIAPGTPAPVPRVVLHWKDDQQDPVTERIQSGYAMKLLFGPAFNGRMRGRIFIALPDEEKSFAAGIFDAEIIKLAQPLANK